MQTHDDFATTKTYPEALLLLLPLLLLLLLPLLLLLMLLLVFFLFSTLASQLKAMGAKASNAPQSLKACVPHTLKLSTGGDVTLKVNGGGRLGRPQAQPFLQCLK